MKRKNTKRFKKRSKTRRFKRQRGGNVDILVNTGAPYVSIPPPTDLTVKFLPNSKFSATEFGNVLKNHESASEPKTAWTAPAAGTFYTLLCWDPDASQAAGQAGARRALLELLSSSENHIRMPLRQRFFHVRRHAVRGRRRGLRRGGAGCNKFIYNAHIRRA